MSDQRPRMGTTLRTVTFSHGWLILHLVLAFWAAAFWTGFFWTSIIVGILNSTYACYVLSVIWQHPNLGSLPERKRWQEELEAWNDLRDWQTMELFKNIYPKIKKYKNGEMPYIDFSSSYLSDEGRREIMRNQGSGPWLPDAKIKRKWLAAMTVPPLEWPCIEEWPCAEGKES